MEQAAGSMVAIAEPMGGDDDDDDDDGAAAAGGVPKKAGRRKINIEFIEDKSRRHITFSKRKAGIMKKAYELSALTGTQVLLLVASETGHVYTYATEKLQPLIQKPEGKNLIQTCLSAPDQVQTDKALPQVPDSQYAAMAAAAAAAQQAAVADRPAKQRKVAPGGVPVSAAQYGGAPGGVSPYGGRGMPFPGASMGLPPALAAQAAQAAAQARGGLPFGMDPRSLPGMPGMPQGLNPALLQGLMNGQMPPGLMGGMDGMMGGAKMDALQQTIADAAQMAAQQQQ
jgi:hypothetical protein